jgi:hypothetical protein
MTQSSTKLSRRTLFAGAGTAGALAAAVSVLPSLKGSALPVAEALKPAPENGGGYSLSAHVKQYYKTTLI